MAGGIIGAVVGQIASQVVSQTLGSIISQFGEANVLGSLVNSFMKGFGDILKNAISQAPIPSFLKDAANSVIDDIIGKNQQPTTPECQCALDQSGASREAEEIGGKIAMDVVNNATEDNKKKKGSSGSNWLVVLAATLAEVQGKFLERAMGHLGEMEKLTGEKDGSKFMKEQSEYQATMRMFGMMSEATSTTLKTIGEALQSLSRKQ